MSLQLCTQLTAFVFTVVFGAVSSAGRDLHVDPAKGDDHNDGIAQPLKTIPQAIKFAQPGDTIHLRPVVYRDYAGFYNKRGEPGRPITLDGHGATLEGSDPIDPAAWREVSPGLFSNDRLLPRLDDAIIGRWFFLWDGQMNHMGRTSKGTSAPLKRPEELQPGEWTFVKDEARKLPDSRQVFGTFYVKLPPGQELGDAKIAAPVRSAGVQFSGTNAHLIIRNLTATHPYNDGFNIHGHCEDVLFENIRAIECGDDGISAHETAQYRVDGFVSIGNSTGICDTGASITSYNRVFIRDCLAFDLYFLDSGRFSVSNSIVLSTAARAFTVTGRDNLDRPCSLVLENVLFHRVGGPGELRVTKNSVLDARRVTLLGLDVQATGGEVRVRDSVIASSPAVAVTASPYAYIRASAKPRGVLTPEIVLGVDAKWIEANNRYDLASLRVDRKTFTAETFAEFQKLTGSDDGSRWAPFTVRPAGVGADEASLMALMQKAGDRQEPGR